MVAINLNDPASLIQSLGLYFFVGFLIGVIAGWVATERVYIALGVGVAVGCIAFLLFGAAAPNQFV